MVPPLTELGSGTDPVLVSVPPSWQVLPPWVATDEGTSAKPAMMPTSGRMRRIMLLASPDVHDPAPAEPPQVLVPEQRARAGKCVAQFPAAGIPRQSGDV